MDSEGARGRAGDILKVIEVRNALGARELRTLEVLRAADVHDDHGWFMFLPQQFNDALDIRLTPRVPSPGAKPTLMWTQGHEFDFHEGDVIYNTAQAYEGQWSEALRDVNWCVQIRAAAPASRRDRGLVEFTLLRPNDESDTVETYAHFTTTQDDFIHFLITGQNRGTSLDAPKK